jgi:FkbM family methyltransferase
MRVETRDGLLWPAKDDKFGPNPASYQLHKQDEALKYVKNHRVCIDIGAHVGIWSKRLMEIFDQVHAFEPVPQMYSLLRENVPDAHHYPYVLGNESGIKFANFDDAASGCTKIAEHGVEVHMQRLDDFHIEDVDFIKLDCEGYELEALKGGENTIQQYRPVILVEQKANQDALPWLEKRQYKQKGVIAGDYIYV